jgi:Ca2+-binding RTX toxin-like protein
MVQFIDSPVNVKITRMREIDNLDEGITRQADFDSEVTIDGRRFDGQLFEEQDDLNPGNAWSFTNGVSGRVVPFKIRIEERDSGFLGGTGPTVDINPIAGKRSLDLFLDLQTGEIFSTETGSKQVLGFVGQTITLRGSGDQDRGEVSFVVNGTAGTEPANSVIIQSPFLSETPESNDQLGGRLSGGNNPLVSGDFNADGKADLVVGSFFDQTVHVINGTSTGLDQSSLQAKFNQSNLGVEINGQSFAVGDINGDGVDDLVMGGAFGSNSPTTVVRFGRAGSGLTNGQSNISKDPSIVANSSFGATVTTGDFNGDGKDDVVTGAVVATVAGQSGAGAIQINYGSATGISNNRQVFDRNTPGILGIPTANARFGDALAAGDVNGDGFEDLIVGVSGAPDTAAGAGAFHVIYGSATGLTTANNQLIGQSASGQANQAGDLFGGAIAVADINGDGVDDVVVGAPGKNNDAGQVYVYQGRRGQSLSSVASRILTQTNLNAGLSQAGDQFGVTLDAKDVNNDGFADIVIGVPGETNGANGAGVAHLVLGSAAGVSSTVRTIDQGVAGVAGRREAGDQFGTGIAIGNFDGAGAAELAVSAPGEDFGAVQDAGLVNIVPAASLALPASAFSLSAIQSTRTGTNKNDTLLGTDANGIISGEAGNDQIDARGGNDLLLGERGNDTLLAGAGDDLIFGGKGRDTLTGDQGRDTFVLASKYGTDVITDFQAGEDFLGLAEGLQFADLQMFQQGSSTILKAHGQRLAILENVITSSLTANDFLQVGFTTYEGMTVPTILG